MKAQREIKFEIRLRRKDGTDGYFEILTLDELINRNGSLFHPNIWEVVYKRQFTGLTDKNGKEIYQGDIIQTEEITWIISFGNPSDYKDMFGWVAASVKSGSTYFMDKAVCSGEVIGNIYENPELLK